MYPVPISGESYMKSTKIPVQIILIIIIIVLSAWFGENAAAIMSSSAPVKNGMLCQIIFLAGIISGAVLCLAFQEIDRRFS